MFNPPPFRPHILVEVGHVKYHLIVIRRRFEMSDRFTLKFDIFWDNEKKLNFGDFPQFSTTLGALGF